MKMDIILCTISSATGLFWFVKVAREVTCSLSHAMVLAYGYSFLKNLTLHPTVLDIYQSISNLIFLGGRYLQSAVSEKPGGNGSSRYISLRFQAKIQY